MPFADRRYQGAGKACVDVDECKTQNGGCDKRAFCINQEGKLPKCVCMPGFAGSGNQCVDKDECKSGQDKCSAYATCTNSDGSYNCKCKPGFAGDGLYCSDVDECAKGIKTCGANEDCVNSKGGVQCQCSTGFKKQGNSCINPNTCNPSCGNNQMCIKDKLGFSCQCKPGYTKDLQGNCGDLDECSVNNGGCSYLAQCANQKGSSPVCTCKTGYFGDGKTCVPDKVTVTLHSVLIHPAKGGKQHWDGFGKIDPGNAVEVNFGMGVALNEMLSFSLGYDHKQVQKIRLNGITGPAARTLQVGRFLVGGSFRPGGNTTFNVTLGVGVTEDSPDLDVMIRVPVSLDIFN